MPNHCTNTVLVTGPSGEVKRFWDRITSDDPSSPSLSSLMPMPKGIDREFGTEWIRWAYDNWGTKWGDYDYSYAEFDGDEIELEFLTAWGPFSQRFWTAVSEMFPLLMFVITYDEQWMDFMGLESYTGGEIHINYYVDSVTDAIGPMPDWDDPEYERWMDRKMTLLKIAGL